MDERQWIKWLGENIPGYKKLVNWSKGKQPNPSRYTKYGKVLDKSQVKRHELVGDKYNPERGEFANPETDGGLIPLMLTGTPKDLAIETIGTGTGEVLGSGTAGAVSGLIASLLTRGKPKTMKAENKTLDYVNDYRNAYGNDYRKPILDAYGRPTGYYGDYTKKAPENLAERVARITSNPSNEIPLISSNQLIKAYDLPEKGLPRLNPDGTITGLDPADVDNALLEKYGDKAVDFFHEGKTYKNFEDGMGYMRGNENEFATLDINPKSGKRAYDGPAKYFGRTRVQHIDRDRKDPLHNEIFVTLNELGEAEELARRYVQENPWERSLVFQSTPGGASILDVGIEGARSRKSSKGLIDFLNSAKAQNADPAYLNFTVDRWGEDVLNWYKNLPDKLKSTNPEIAHYLASEHIKRKHLRNKAGKLRFKRDGSPLIGNPWVDETWGNLRTNINPFETTDFNAWAKAPRGVVESVPFYNDIRLTAKPQRLLNYHNDMPFTASGNTPAYTREPLFIVGNENATNLHALNTVLGDRGIMDYVKQGRYIQGLQDPIRPEWGKGFGDTSHLQSLSNELSPLGQAEMRKYLQLGLIGPAIYDNLYSEEQD